MKARGLILAVVVLGVLTAFLYWSDRHKPESKTSATEGSPKILSLNQGNISKLDIKRKSGDEVVIAKSGSTWQITSPKSVGADQEAVTMLLSTLSPLSADRVLEEKAGDLKSYGLDDPDLRVTATEGDGKAHQLLIGDKTPTGAFVYAKMEGDSRVYTMGAYSRNSLDKTVDDLRDKRLLPLDPNKISRVELVQKRQDIEFARNKDNWQILRPRPARADGSQVDELVRKLTEAKMDVTAVADDPGKAKSGFASATAVGTVRVTDQSGTQQLELRKNKDVYYAKSSMVEGVYKVSSDLADALAKKLDDYRNKKLFDFGFDIPGKITVRDASKTYEIARNGDDWWMDGKKMDRNTVETLLNYLRDLSASTFLDSGFSAPAIEITVTPDGTKMPSPEKVLIAKAGSGYIAKRDGEAALYGVDAKSVEGIETAAKDVKQVQAPPAK